MDDYIQPGQPHSGLNIGDKVEFAYQGSQEQSGRRVHGEIVSFIPQIKWEGGIVPFSEAGYAVDLKILTD